MTCSFLHPKDGDKLAYSFNVYDWQLGYIEHPLCTSNDCHSYMPIGAYISM